MNYNMYGRDFLSIIEFYTQIYETVDISSFSLKQTYINSRECPYCHSHHVVSKGNYKKRKRYLCRDCGKSFNDLTNTPFSGIHNLDKLKKYLNCMINGDSIRKAAYTVKVSNTTSFIWRHKLLDGINNLPSPKMRDVREKLEVKLPYSHKGQRTKLSKTKRNSKISVVFICDRTGKLDSDSIEIENRKNNPLYRRISKISSYHTELINAKTLTETDLNNRPPITPQPYNSHYANSQLITAITTNWYHWMKRFRGVSSKYLRNYLHWYDFLDNVMNKTDKSSKLMKLLLSHT